MTETTWGYLGGFVFVFNLHHHSTKGLDGLKSGLRTLTLHWLINETLALQIFR